jgi:hypothetical protein
MVGKNSKEIITYNKASSPFGSSATPSNQYDIRTTGDVVSGAQFLNPKNWFNFASGKKGNEITIPSKATGVEAHDLEQFKYLDSNQMIGAGKYNKNDFRPSIKTRMQGAGNKSWVTGIRENPLFANKFVDIPSPPPPRPQNIGAGNKSWIPSFVNEFPPIKSPPPPVPYLGGALPPRKDYGGRLVLHKGVNMFGVEGMYDSNNHYVRPLMKGEGRNKKIYCGGAAIDDRIPYNINLQGYAIDKYGNLITNAEFNKNKQNYRLDESIKVDHIYR